MLDVVRPLLHVPLGRLPLQALREIESEAVMGFFDEDFAIIEDQLDEVFSTSVQFQRGSAVTDAFDATWDRNKNLVFEEEEFGTQASMRDWWLPFASVTVHGTQVEPRAGDRILDGNWTWEIMPMGRGPAAEIIDGSQRWLVHTKRIV